MEPLNGKNVMFSILTVMLVTLHMTSARPRPGELEDLQKALLATCIVKHPITEEMMSKAKNGDLPDDRSFKCFLKCTFEEVSLIDDEGNLDGDSVIAVMPNEELKQLAVTSVNSCLPNIAGKPDPCEVSFNFMKCATDINKLAIKSLPF